MECVLQDKNRKLKQSVRLNRVPVFQLGLGEEADEVSFKKESMAEAKSAFGAVDVERAQGTECEEGLFLSSHYWCYL